MFQTEVAARTDGQNRLLAGYLAVVAGFVNASSFLLIGTFTSHVTGNVGRFADDLVLGHREPALLAAVMVLAFFLGAFAASLTLESGRGVRRSWISGSLLFAEAVLLLAFMEFGRRASPGPRTLDAAAAILCFAMGMQNSLVTRLSGAVVRTTHLTGIVTDLGIEAARWVRYWRTRGTPSLDLSERPPVAKTALLATILGSFVMGAAGGAIAATRWRHDAMLVPAVALIGGAGFALLSGTRIDLPGSRR